VTANGCPADKTVVAPNGKRYCDLAETMTAKKCNEDCRSLSPFFSMPCVESADDNAFLKTRQARGAHVWTGLYQKADSFVSEGWDEWLSPGCASTYRSWARGEPNDWFCVAENVAAVGAESEAGEWIDLGAGDSASCVCEERPTASDDDDDKFEDILEELEEEEFAKGCHEGVDDWGFMESGDGEDAVAPGAFVAPSGVTYYDTGRRGDFATCFSMCSDKGWTLPTPKTAEDSAFLAGVRASVTPDRPATWLGLYQSKGKAATSGWDDSNWASLDTSSYRNWAVNEPNDYMCVDETCAIANLPDAHTQMWYDAPCTYPEPACVCEQRPFQQDDKAVAKFTRKVIPRLTRDPKRNACFDWEDLRWEGAFWAMVGALSFSLIVNFLFCCGCCMCFCCKKKENSGAPRLGCCHPNVQYGVTPEGIAVVQAAIPQHQLPPEVQQQFRSGSSLNVSRTDFVFPMANAVAAASAPPMAASAPPSSAPHFDDAVKPQKWAEQRGADQPAQGLYPGLHTPGFAGEQAPRDEKV